MPRSRGGSDGQENQNREKQRQEKQSIEKNSAWAVGGRIGYLVTPAILTSMAATLRRGSAVSPSLVTGSYSFPSQTYTGAIIGGRTEIAMQNWWPGLFWRSEYRYSSFGCANLPLTVDGEVNSIYQLHSCKNVQTITSALVWKSNWLGH